MTDRKKKKIKTTKENRFLKTELNISLSFFDKLIPWIILFILSVISGFLLVLAFPDFGKYLYAFIALSPVLWLWGRSRFGKAFISGYIVALIFYGVLFYWAIELGVHVWIAIILFQGVYLAIWAGIISWYSGGHGLGQNIKTMIFPLLSWIAIEWARTSGPLGLCWGSIGYSQSPNLPIIQSASLFGYYWVASLVLVFNIIIAIYFDRVKKDMISSFGIDWKEIEHRGNFFLILRGLVAPFIPKTGRNAFPLLVLVYLIVLIFSLVFGFRQLAQPPGEDGIKTALVQVNVGMYRPWNNNYLDKSKDNLYELMDEAMSYSPELVIFPETTLPTNLPVGDPLEKKFLDLARKNKIYLLFGIPRVIDHTYRNAAIFISPEGKIINEYHKLHLVPFGEYLPLEKYLRRFSVFDRVQDFTPGEEEVIFDY
ncbi:MAG: apolipoprotein N-acyltransferase, partial [Candidatus Eremiobacteraeota bacterium]|nr:apolipoprotein N-acyltransferase [Candidatus Eremiobacteraeota bacterium]